MWQVYLPMSYIYGKRFAAPLDPLTAALREELYVENYGQARARPLFFPPTLSVLGFFSERSDHRRASGGAARRKLRPGARFYPASFVFPPRLSTPLFAAREDLYVEGYGQARASALRQTCYAPPGSLAGEYYVGNYGQAPQIGRAHV